MCPCHSTLPHAAVRADARDRLVRGLQLRRLAEGLGLAVDLDPGEPAKAA